MTTDPTLDPTLDPRLRSWVPVPSGSDFPIQNLPYGVFRRSGESARIGVAIGDSILDLASVAVEGLLPTDIPAGLFISDTLAPIMVLGRTKWTALRKRISQLLSSADRTIRDIGALPARVIVPMREAELLLPVSVGDYVDFYSSIEHATNLGKIFRPDQEPLLPNWRHMPVGYHGRSGSIVVSGAPITRPRGQIRKGDAAPEWSPTEMLDVELEVGFITGTGNELGRPLTTGEAEDHIFGLVLVNDWSARDIQAWEYVPLGPFLGKSFATSMSPWVVTLDALAPYRVAGPIQEPPVLEYLRTEGAAGVDLNLEIALAAGPDAEPEVISRTNLRHMYWSMAQQLAHATANGAPARPGDLFASGTISGPDPGSYGSLIELTWRGTQPLELADGRKRTFLEDGDSVTMRGWCAAEGAARIGFGEVTGAILPAPVG